MSDADGPVCANFADDAQLDHPWASRYRLPLVTSVSPMWSYEVALVVPDGEPVSPFRLLAPTWPSEQEAALIGCVIDYRRGYYNERWASLMLRRPFDVDSGTNTLILIRTEQGWAFRRRTWEMGPILRPEWTPDLPGLVALLDNAMCGGHRWEKWKVDHAEVFAPQL